MGRIAEVLGAAAICVPVQRAHGLGVAATAAAADHRRRTVATVQQMAIEWSVVPVEIEECKDVEDLWARSLEAARETEARPAR